MRGLQTLARIGAVERTDGPNSEGFWRSVPGSTKYADVGSQAGGPPIEDDDRADRMAENDLRRHNEEVRREREMEGK